MDAVTALPHQKNGAIIAPKPNGVVSGLPFGDLLPPTANGARNTSSRELGMKIFQFIVTLLCIRGTVHMDDVVPHRALTVL
jgi:hypothetical protein